MIVPAAVMLISGCLSQFGSGLVEGRAEPLLTGTRFRQEMERPFSGSWSHVELRQLLKEVAADRCVSIVLDRRLDPSAEYPIQVSNASLRTGLIGIARQVGGDVSLPDNVVFLGPKTATKTLRTLIELRSLELQSKEAGIAKPRRSELLRLQKFRSADLETPQDILAGFTSQSHIQIINAEIIPHDLWAAMILPDVSVIEALSVVLVQFDLTFQWMDAGRSIELIPIPELVSLERKHASKHKAADARSLILQHYPRLKVDVTKSEVLVSGSLEDHEGVTALLRGDGVRNAVKIEAPQPLRKQVWTLEARRVPISSLMKTLEESAVTFEFDPEEMNSAGIDLDQRVDINVKQVSAGDFFKSIFDPAGVDFEIDGLTVKLRPKRK